MEMPAQPDPSPPRRIRNDRWPDIMLLLFILFCFLVPALGICIGTVVTWPGD